MIGLWSAPGTFTRNVRNTTRLIAARAVRGFADGALSIVLVSYLAHLGLSTFQTGAIVTGTLLGSAALTLAVGIRGGSIARRTMLFVAAALMFFTGVGFATATTFALLFFVAVVARLSSSTR